MAPPRLSVGCCTRALVLVRAAAAFVGKRASKAHHSNSIHKYIGHVHEFVLPSVPRHHVFVCVLYAVAWLACCSHMRFAGFFLTRRVREPRSTRPSESERDRSQRRRTRARLIASPLKSRIASRVTGCITMISGGGEGSKVYVMFFCFCVYGAVTKPLITSAAPCGFLSGCTFYV